MEKLIEYIKSSAENLNQNKYIIGFAMILLNIGARFIIDELDDDTRSLTKHRYVMFLRILFIFYGYPRFVQSNLTHYSIHHHHE